jgi:hypothetical protein
MADDSSTADVDMRKAWRALAGKMAERPGWLASCWPRSEWPALWDRLGLDEDAGLQLLVCKPPRPDQWDADLAQLAEFVKLDRLQLEVELLAVQAQWLRAGRAWERWWYPERNASTSGAGSAGVRSMPPWSNG